MPKLAKWAVWLLVLNEVRGAIVVALVILGWMHSH